MKWHVSYVAGETASLEWHLTPEMAIESACRHMDVGHTVFGMGIGEPSDSISPECIKRIYAIWVKDDE